MKKERGKFNILQIFPSKNDSKSLRKYKIGVLVCVGVVLLLVLAFFCYWFVDFGEQKKYDDIADNYHKFDTILPDGEQDSQGYFLKESRYQMLPSALKLMQINTRIVGYIQIPGAEIDYPILKYNNIVGWDTHYLKRDTREKESRNGSLFMDYYSDFDTLMSGENSVEYADISTVTNQYLKNSDNVIVYGHNSVGDMMFGGLRHFEDKNYALEHQIINFNSNYKKYEYKVFAVCKVETDLNKKDDTRYFDYYNYPDFTEENYTKFMNRVRETAFVYLETPEKDTPLLTLSTCFGAVGGTDRLIVLAYRIQE